MKKYHHQCVIVQYLPCRCDLMGLAANQADIFIRNCYRPKLNKLECNYFSYSYTVARSNTSDEHECCFVSAKSLAV